MRRAPAVLLILAVVLGTSALWGILVVGRMSCGDEWLECFVESRDSAAKKTWFIVMGIPACLLAAAILQVIPTKIFDEAFMRWEQRLFAARRGTRRLNQKGSK